MKRLGKIAVCLAGSLALNAGLRADDQSPTNSPLADNPYAAIVVRNIFGLVPPPPPDDPSKAAAKDLPKITPTGIQSLFGHTKALFKVTGTGGKPGQPAKDAYYILSQGQMQDDIEVVKIDGKKNLVTFNNHGITQELPLTSAPSGGGSGAAATGGMGNPGMNPGAAPGGGSPGGFTHFGGNGYGGNSGGAGGGNPGNNNPGSGPNGGMNFGANNMQGRIYQPPASTMTPEQTAIVIETKRAELMNSPHPEYPPGLLPPTVLTPLNTSGGGNGNTGE
jgi:hypothetical protein